MKNIYDGNIPELFRQLTELVCIDTKDICAAQDGFYALRRSLADILVSRGIESLPGESGRDLICRLFFDDWYLYALPRGEGWIYSLFKMREQEYDAKMGLFADGDTPGVTVSFIEFHSRFLLDCLLKADEENKRVLNREIHRVVAAGGQRHSKTLKAYFVRTKAQGPYLAAKLYTDFIASLACGGSLPVPEHYAALYKKGGGPGRLPCFIEANNADARCIVCDHERIYIKNPACPTKQERLAILATHTGNVSFFSFAAEVQFHALFLLRATRIPLPFIGRSVYASAIRADMSIDDGELTGPTPYYRSNSILVKRQLRCHGGSTCDI